MSKLSAALAVVAAASAQVEWKTGGQSIEVVTTYFEADGTEAGSVTRNYLADQPVESPDAPETPVSENVTVGVTGAESAGQGAAL